MYRYIFPLAFAAAALPCAAQHLPDPITAAAAATHRTANLATLGSAKPAAPAAGELTLTLAMALARVQDSNPTLAGARHELAAVAAGVLQAQQRPNPTLAVELQDQRRSTRESTLTLSQPLELGGKRGYRVHAAETARDSAAAELQTQWLAVRCSVTQAFYDVLVAQERQSLASDSVNNAQRSTAAVAKRVLAGKISPVEETKARLAEASVRLELLQAKSALDTSRQRLAALWGQRSAAFDLAVGALAELPALPDLAGLTQQLAASPTLARAHSELARQQALADVERSNRVPDVAVSVGMKRLEEQGRNVAIVGLSVPLPLFDRNQGNLLAALRRTDQARDALAATTLDQETELTQAYAKWESARDAVTALRGEILPGARQAYDAASTGFDFGKFSFLDVLDAQRTLLSTRTLYLSALGDAHHAAADIERLTAGASAAAALTSSTISPD